jgi:hypothetical protein
VLDLALGYDPSNTGDPFGGWHLGGIYSPTSGFPFSPQLVRTDRIANGNPPSGNFGNAGRNILTGAGVNLLDGSIRKEFATTETQRLEFRAEFFNMLNHPNFAQPEGFIDDGPGAAGVITSVALPMRQIQFGLKYRF